MRDGNDALSQCIRRLAEFAVDVGQAPISPEVEHFGRLLLLDSLGALVGGTRYPAVRAMRDLIGGQRLAGSDLPFGPLFTLGSAATWLDADSGGSFHPEGHRLPPVPRRTQPRTSCPSSFTVLPTASTTTCSSRLSFSQRKWVCGSAQRRRFGRGCTPTAYTARLRPLPLPACCGGTQPPSPRQQ